MVLPSSQISDPALNPSPHKGFQTVFPLLGYKPFPQSVHTLPLQIYPDSIVEQVPLQPSPLFVFPSSQASEPAVILSPH